MQTATDTLRYVFRRPRFNRNKTFDVRAFDGDRLVGSATFAHPDDYPEGFDPEAPWPKGYPKDGEVAAVMVHVKPEWRRKGVATKLYEVAERESGKRIVPSNYQYADGREFWKHRAAATLRRIARILTA